ncbi:MAG: ferritin-like domain-containing protein [Rhodospirillaceae bacterium]|nr:ferritin-like domain-containing protein [Rhodospirillaceae bacterium]MBT6830422.1 ferritin-like domain-containing protein [Rhodospirillaceae bacterium]
MGHWTLDDINWDSFEPDKVDTELLKLVKAACMIEHHSSAYGQYLCAIFNEEPGVCEDALTWSEEEVQHGKALRRYAELADPNFDFDDAFARFTKGHPIDVAAEQSIRGSLCGEMVARCAVEVGTSSYYSALRDSIDEPVLREICRNIAADEFRHFKLFYKYAKHFQETERLSRWARFKIALGRFLETGDDELSFAYYCGSGDTKPYVRKQANTDCMARTLPLYRFEHVQLGVGMSLKSAGIKPQGILGKTITRMLWIGFRLYARHLQRAASYA